MYDNFSSQCQTVIEKCVPKYKQNTKAKRPKWMTSVIWNQLSSKERAWKRLRARKTTKRQQNYRQERNKATEMVRKAKKEFEKTLIKDIKKS